MLHVSQLEKRCREHGAVLEARGFRAQENDGSPWHPAQTSQARARAAKLAAMELEPDALGDSCELGEHALDVHVFSMLTY
jgi:hypothetical protein